MATKAELCLAIYSELKAEHGENHKAIRPAFIAKAVSDAGCTPAGAATYYANCKNRGGATGEVRERHSVDPNYVSPYAGKPDNLPEDSRPLFSAVQRDKQGRVAHVAAYMNQDDAVARATKVRGIAVYGAPNLGMRVSDLKEIATEVK